MKAVVAEVVVVGMIGVPGSCAFLVATLQASRSRFRLSHADIARKVSLLHNLQPEQMLQLEDWRMLVGVCGYFSYAQGESALL